jgi:hypothetical protein
MQVLPCGFFDCQFQASLTACSTDNVALQPNNRAALLPSAYDTATSPARRGPTLLTVSQSVSQVNEGGVRR